VPVVAAVLMLLFGLALGGCAMPDFESFRTPDASTLFRPMSVTHINERRLAAVTAADTVDAEGRCAASASANPETSGGATPGDQSSAPLISAGIAVDMTECEVVHRAGAPERVEIGTNERSERTATLTFIRGARPGIYHFTAGRLTSMERAPEPPAPPKPARPQRRASTPSQTVGR
jgi:hypothetical protein